MRNPAEFGEAANCHTFRATGITAYLLNGGTLERAQAIAAHESPRTTKLYDRTSDDVTVEDIEKVWVRLRLSGRAPTKPLGAILATAPQPRRRRRVDGRGAGRLQVTSVNGAISPICTIVQ